MQRTDVSYIAEREAEPLSVSEPITGCSRGSVVFSGGVPTSVHITHKSNMTKRRANAYRAWWLLSKANTWHIWPGGRELIYGPWQNTALAHKKGQRVMLTASASRCYPLFGLDSNMAWGADMVATYGG